MIFVVAVLLAADVDVKAPPECVALADVMVAVESAGGLDTAERVSVKVDAADVAPSIGDAADPAVDPYVLTVDVALVGSPPLHRVTPLRTVECKDVPDLVAVLVKSARAARVVEKAPAPDDKRPPAGLPPAERTKSNERPAVVDSYDPCDGPPSCGGKLFGIGLSVGAEAPAAARAQIDATVNIVDKVALVFGVDSVRDQSNEAFLGGAYRLRIDKVVVDMRGLIGAGNASTSLAGGLGAQKSCAPGTTSATAAALVDAHTSDVLFVAPTFAARLRYAWLFVEVGGTWQLGASAAPAAFVDIGVQLLDD